MSDYVPTDWVDDVTPVDAARMDKIEAGIDAADSIARAAQAALTGKEDKSAKGAASGYAPLGADSKVPALYLPAAGGAIEYENAWAAGTAYQPGDVVIHNGIEYIAVNPSTGQTPPPSPAVAGATVIPLVTALPASPFDGQTVDLTNSLTSPNWVWRLRYVAAKASNKWVFVGGSPIFSEVTTMESPPTSFGDAPTVGPSITVPVAGSYEISLGMITDATTGGDYAYMSYSIGGAAPVIADGIRVWMDGGRVIEPSRTRVKSFAATTLVAKYQQVPGFISGRWMRLSPVAVG